MTTGYLAFLLSMMKADRRALGSADPVKLAAKYQVDPSWAAMSIRHWLGGR